MELFVWVLLVFAWVAWQIIQRALKPPKPLGTVRDEAPGSPPAPGVPGTVPQPLSDIEWGRPQAPLPPPRPRPTPERFVWEDHAAQAEVAAARAMARRQAAERELRQQARQRRRVHPRRPLLHTQDGLRDAVAAAAVLGPCRALAPYEPPG